VLRETHTVLALLLFATFLAHLGAALMHALIFRDDVFPSMTFWGLRERAGTASGGRDSAAHASAAPALVKSEYAKREPSSLSLGRYSCPRLYPLRGRGA
jgi:hypothetical protein